MPKKQIEVQLQEVKMKCDEILGCSKCSFYIPVIGGKGCYFKHVQPYLWDLEYIKEGLEVKK